MFFFNSATGQHSGKFNKHLKKLKPLHFTAQNHVKKKVPFFH